MLYVLYEGFAGRSDRRAAIAAAVVAGESLVFAANGFRCPLTEIAEGPLPLTFWTFGACVPFRKI